MSTSPRSRGRCRRARGSLRLMASILRGRCTLSGRTPRCPPRWRSFRRLGRSSGGLPAGEPAAFCQQPQMELRMRRALLFIALAGCASGGNAPPEESPSRQPAIFTSSETGTLYGERPRASTIAIAAAPGAVWLAGKKAYLDLDIPVGVENPAARQLGNANFYKIRQIGGRSMTDFVDCGNGMTGPKAATYKIYISLLTMVVPDGKGGTNVQTTFVPSGQDMTGSSSDKIPCGTTGRFEQM